MRIMERYFISADNSGHKYYVPVSMRGEFQAWAELPEDSEAGWEAPEYAHRIDGEFTFTDPRCE